MSVKTDAHTPRGYKHMATAKKVTKVAAPAPKSAAQIAAENTVNNAYKTLAAASGLQPKDRVDILASVDSRGRNIPKGSKVTPTDTNRYLSGTTTFLGFNADGDAMIYWYNKPIAIPNTFIVKAAQDQPQFKLNNSYNAVVQNDGQNVRVGCQDIPADRVLELARNIEAARTAAATRAAAVPNTTFAATYVPKPKAAKKAVAKKAAK